MIVSLMDNFMWPAQELVQQATYLFWPLMAKQKILFTGKFYNSHYPVGFLINRMYQDFQSMIDS